MHLGVDDAGQHEEPLGVEHLVGTGRIEGADVGDALAGDGDVYLCQPGGRDDLSALDEKIPVFSHRIHTFLSARITAWRAARSAGGRRISDSAAPRPPRRSTLLRPPPPTSPAAPPSAAPL